MRHGNIRDATKSRRREVTKDDKVRYAGLRDKGDKEIY
jgi:hypothetical protein